MKIRRIKIGNNCSSIQIRTTKKIILVFDWINMKQTQETVIYMDSVG